MACRMTGSPLARWGGGAAGDNGMIASSHTQVGLGRVVASEKEAPIIFVNLV
jgi:hypothetical protein